MEIYEFERLKVGEEVRGSFGPATVLTKWFYDICGIPCATMKYTGNSFFPGEQQIFHPLSLLAAADEHEARRNERAMRCG